MDPGYVEFQVERAEILIYQEREINLPESQDM